MRQFPPEASFPISEGLEHRKRLLSRIRHFRREIGNGTVLHALSLAVMHAGGEAYHARYAPCRRRTDRQTQGCNRIANGRPRFAKDPFRTLGFPTGR